MPRQYLRQRLKITPMLDNNGHGVVQFLLTALEQYKKGTAMNATTVQSTQARFAILVYTRSPIPICQLLQTSDRQEALETATALKAKLPKSQRQSTRIKVLDMVHLVATVI